MYVSSLSLSPYFFIPSLPLSLQVILALGDYMNVQCHACIGGTNVGEDIRKLDYGQHVVAGTPGRVFGKSFISPPFRYCLLMCCENVIECSTTC